MGGTELISMPLTLRSASSVRTLNETDSIRCKVHYRENDPSPVLGIFKLGCISMILSKFGNRGPDKAAHTKFLASLPGRQKCVSYSDPGLLLFDPEIERTLRRARQARCRAELTRLASDNNSFD
ncbi:hypothetical protein PIB30_060469 [Stylosanthes scabra]|uniref:Uncharacterized protein n=1 Tax=Stylosanthes scabra TaxID=79078 RepID=A0ABU6RKQ3_9FABA|nr:hypothetical protein [Stylosanthes scabra]